MQIDNKIEFLKERGLFSDCTNPAGLEEKLADGKVTFYVGFDATAKSLHVGHLLPIMLIRWLQKWGNQPIVLVGGGTTLVGDPTGKDTSRPMLSEQDIIDNGKAIKSNLERFIDFKNGDNKAILLNNADWLKPINFIEFLRDVGSRVPLSQMLSKESVKLRLAKESPMTFLEFNYQLMQAFDFLHLNEHHDCILQMGGSDQWGNIVSGIELVRRVRQQEVIGLTCPLVQRSDGKKMGKSEGGAIWLDPGMCSNHDYSSYWRGVDDRDVEKFLLMFTELGTEKIRRLVLDDLDHAKWTLAEEATRMRKSAMIGVNRASLTKS